MWNHVVQVSQHIALLFQVTGFLHLPHNFIDELRLDGPGFDSTLLDEPGFNSTSFALLSIMNNKYIEDVWCH